MTRYGLLLSIGLGYLFFPAQAFGWGKDGHVIVAKIAELRLSAKARAAIKELLDDRSIADPQLASWADLIKHSRMYSNKYPNNRSWHFVDIPFDAKSLVSNRDCKRKDCVIDRIEEFCEVLKNQSVSRTARKEALLFLVHLVGDLHQPLHCAERGGDHGGNLLSVTYAGKGNLNLHRVWDSNLVADCLGGLEPQDYAQRCDSRITVRQKQEWEKGSIADWAWESHKLAVDRAYHSPDGRPLPTTGTPDLDHAYIAKSKPIVEEQLEKAGIRLAKLLNESLN